MYPNDPADALIGTDQDVPENNKKMTQSDVIRKFTGMPSKTRTEIGDPGLLDPLKLSVTLPGTYRSKGTIYVNWDAYEGMSDLAFIPAYYKLVLHTIKDPELLKVLLSPIEASTVNGQMLTIIGYRHLMDKIMGDVHF